MSRAELVGFAVLYYAVTPLIAAAGACLYSSSERSKADRQQWLRRIARGFALAGTSGILLATIGWPYIPPWAISIGLGLYAIGWAVSLFTLPIIAAGIFRRDCARWRCALAQVIQWLSYGLAIALICELTAERIAGFSSGSVLAAPIATSIPAGTAIQGGTTTSQAFLVYNQDGSVTHAQTIPASAQVYRPVPIVIALTGALLCVAVATAAAWYLGMFVLGVTLALTLHRALGDRRRARRLPPGLAAQTES